MEKITISEDKAKDIRELVNVLMVTATDIETTELLKIWEPIPGIDSFITTFIGPQTYTIGKMGNYCVVHVQCSSQGATGRDSSIQTCRDAIEFWSPKAIIMVGIAFGIDPEKQKIGDVLIAKEIVPYEIAKIKKENVINRGPIVQSGMTLYNRFLNLRDWSHMIDYPDINRIEKAEKICGKMLSGEKLIDSEDYLMQLLKEHKEVIGGEMEGFGLYSSAAHLNVHEWIVVKGICDWARNKESVNKDKYQNIAIQSALSLCIDLLLQKDVLRSLGIKDILDAPLLINEKKK